MATKRSLEEGLEQSATKKGYSGAKRHQYIGGALRNMQKKGEITLKPRAKKATSSRPARAASSSHSTTKKTPAAPAKKAYVSPSLTKREHLTLYVKENKAASAKVPNSAYKLYSLYNKKTGAQYGTGTYRKKSAAEREAKIEMDAHNDIRGVHTRGRLA